MLAWSLCSLWSSTQAWKPPLPPIVWEFRGPLQQYRRDTNAAAAVKWQEEVTIQRKGVNGSIIMKQMPQFTIMPFSTFCSVWQVYMLWCSSQTGIGQKNPIWTDLDWIGPQYGSRWAPAGHVCSFICWRYLDRNAVQEETLHLGELVKLWFPGRVMQWEEKAECDSDSDKNGYIYIALFINWWTVWFQYDGTSVSTCTYIIVTVFFPIIPLEPLNCHFSQPNRLNINVYLHNCSLDFFILLSFPMYKKYSRCFDTFIVKFVKDCNISTYFSFILYYVK